MTQGELFKEGGQESVLDHNTEWKDVAIVELIKVANSHQEFTSDDLREQMARIPVVPSHCNAIGAIFSAAAKSKLIKRTGRYVKSKIPSCHSRVVSVWTKAL